MTNTCYNNPVTTISLDDIQRDVLGFLQRVEAGETLLIVHADKPLAELKPVFHTATQQKRPVGLCAGDFIVPDDFDAPLPDAVLDAFEGR